MRTSVFVLLLGIVLAYAAEDDVIVLDSKNFDSIVNPEELILVEFYAPWCGHCKNLVPAYAEAAGILKKNDPPILLAKVDADAEKSLGSRFNIRGFPTLKIFRKGVDTEYNGPRDANGIVNYMKKQVGPSAKPLTSAEAVKAFTEDREPSIIGFFTDKNAELAKAFTQTADTLREKFRFGLVTEKSVLIEGDYKQAVVLFKPYDEKKNVYTGGNTKDDLTNWIYEKSLAVAGEITLDNQERYTRKNIPIVKVIFDVDYSSNLKRTNYYVNRLRKVAENSAFQGKLLFAIAKKSSYSADLDKVGLSGKDFGVIIDDHSNNLRYKFTADEFNVKNLEQFVQDFLGGKLKAYIKSEPIPDNTGKNVKVVVGENFKDIVLDKTKDVLIELYAPWCGHCKKLEPIFEDLGSAVKSVDNLVIAKMDATANDSPHGKYQAKGYPTILYAPANNKDNPVPYSGERDVAAFKAFLKQNANAAVWGKKDL